MNFKIKFLDFFWKSNLKLTAKMPSVSEIATQVSRTKRDDKALQAILLLEEERIMCS